MPKRKRHLPGKYQPKPELKPNFNGLKPMTLFHTPNGLWGVKDAAGNIVIKPIYEQSEQTEREKERKAVLLVSQFDVIEVTPDDWDLVAFYSPD